MESKRNIVLSNFFWRFLERCGAHGVTFIVSIILARLLDPSVYGTIALVTVITNIMQVFVDSGLGNALIQKKDADDLDFSTVFWFNIGSCILLYLFMYFSAPFISSYYQIIDLTPVIRVLSIIIIISGVKNIQQAYVSKNMLFKKFFYATLGGTIGAAIIGISLAYLGFGVWALVAQMIFNALVDTIILWLTVKWRPKLMFSYQRLKRLFNFGWKLLISALIDKLYNDLRQLIIGKKYSTSDLAYYNRGESFPSLVVSNINTAIDSVLFPTMSCAQDDSLRVKSMTRRAIKTSTYIMMPLMIGLAVCAESVVSILLADKWIPCVPFLRLFCISYAFWPIHTANLNAIKAMGRSDLFLKIEIIKKVIGIIAILFTMRISALAMAYGVFATSIISQIINSWPNKHLLNYGYFEQLKDLIPQIVLSCIMGAIVYFVKLLGMSTILTLFIQIVIGGTIYFAMSKVLHIESYEYLASIIRRNYHDNLQ